MPTREEMVAFLRSKTDPSAQPQTTQPSPAPTPGASGSWSDSGSGSSGGKPSREEMVSFLKQKQEAALNPPSLIGTAGRAALQNYTGGFSDELMGLGEAAGRALGIDGAGARPVSQMSLSPGGPTLDLDKLKAAYELGRNHERQALKIDADANPKTAAVTGLVGMLASPINKLAPGSGMAVNGAIMGGVNAAGSSEAKTPGALATDVALGTGFGAALGKGAEIAEPYIGKAVSKLNDVVQPYVDAAGQNLGSIARKAAFKAGGAMKRDFVNAAERGTLDAQGQAILDNGLKIGDQPSDVAKAAQAKVELAGNALDDVYSRARAKFGATVDNVGLDPARDKAAIMEAASKELGVHVDRKVALQKLSNYLDDIAESHGDAPNKAATDEFNQKLEDYFSQLKQYSKDRLEFRGSQKISNPDAPLKTQMELPEITSTDQATNRAFGKPGDAVFNGVNEDANLRVGAKARAAVAETAQADDLARNSSAQIVQNGKQQNLPGFLQEPTRPIRPTAPAEVSNPMDPRSANNIKTALDQKINYARSPFSNDPASEIAFSAARKAVAQKVDQGIESLGGDALLDELKAANKQYGTNKSVAYMATDRANAIDAHKAMFGLTDTIAATGAAAYGAYTHDWKGAVGMFAAKKAIEKYGTTTMAVAADRLSQKLLAEPALAKLAEAEPKVFQATVIRLTHRALDAADAAPVAAMGAAAQNKNELDRDSSVPASYKTNDGASNMPTKGSTKWASDGHAKLMSHASDDVDTSEALDDSKSQLMSDPKSKELLMQASDLKPGSKAMSAVLEKVKSKMKAGK